MRYTGCLLNDVRAEAEETVSVKQIDDVHCKVRVKTVQRIEHPLRSIVNAKLSKFKCFVF